MKKTILIPLVILLFSCTKEDNREVVLNENNYPTVKPIDGEWIHSYTIYDNYHYLKKNNLFNSPDTIINISVNISNQFWGNDRINMFIVDKETRVQFLDTNRYFFIEQYFPDKMIINESNIVTHFYYR